MTVTLDPDVADQLRELARHRNVSFTFVLNDMVSTGLAVERVALALSRRSLARWGCGRVST
jgi:predicted transcriptional regulator